MGINFKTATTTDVKPASPYDKHLVSTPAKGKVTITKGKSEKDGTKTEKIVMDTEEVVHPGIVSQKEKQCMMTVGGGSTINLGNYEFARIDVSLTMPTNKEELDETFEFITKWVGSKIEEAVKNSKE